MESNPPLGHVVINIELCSRPCKVTHHILEAHFDSILKRDIVNVAHAIAACAFADNGLGVLSESRVACLFDEL